MVAIKKQKKDFHACLNAGRYGGWHTKCRCQSLLAFKQLCLKIDILMQNKHVGNYTSWLFQRWQVNTLPPDTLFH